jgi:peptidoglycan/xylan/chitin deacetylase (PgdA/CDA1 family)
MLDPSYTIVLTHDVDFLSLRSYPLFSRVALSFVKECLAGNLVRLFRRELAFRTYLRSFFWGLGLPFIKLGIIRDPWEKSIDRIMNLERRYGVKSTFFFIPFKNQPGHLDIGQKAPQGRAAQYQLEDYKKMLISLEKQGWEVGVHGLNAHLATEEASRELRPFRDILSSKKRWGMRMHWLYRSPRLESHLKNAGYYYDSTFGSNEAVGFPEGHEQPFQKDDFWVLPMNIQDVTLLARWRKNLPPKRAWAEIESLLDQAKIKRAVVTVLWHNNSFGPPRFWEDIYERILQKGGADGAGFKRAIDAFFRE